MTQSSWLPLVFRILFITFLSPVLAMGPVSSPPAHAAPSLEEARTPQSPRAAKIPKVRKYAKHPRLIVMIVIDQFRADYLTRFEARFLPPQNAQGDVGGFEYLMSQGAYFPFGQYDLMQSFTGPGHATVLTGAYPYQAGIPLNSWQDHTLKRPVYCVEDLTTSIVGGSAEALKAASDAGGGMSPKNLIATTFGDELKNAGFPSRVISIALKDRSSILMGGHRADLSLWFNSKLNQWVSSQYYLPNKTLPDWVQRLNQETLPPVGKSFEWKATASQTGYSDTNSHALMDAANAGGFGGKSFPHLSRFGTNAALASPLGLELTEIAAERAMDAYSLGNGPTPDLLAVSFSSHDVVGHAFGPNSREMEEMTLAEDRAISRLLNAIRKKVPGGLKEVVIAFTGDHGIAPAPEWASAHGLDAGRIDEDELAQALSSAMNEKWGRPSEGNWVTAATNFNFYLNLPEIRNKKIDPSAMELFGKQILEKDPRISYVFTYTDYRNRKLPPGIHERQILHSYYPGRNGDIVIIAKPYYVPTGATANHFTGYSYDRTVPVILSGLHVKPGTYATRAEVIDIAPTLSFLSGVIPPNLSEGRVLSEILE